LALAGFVAPRKLLSRGLIFGLVGFFQASAPQQAEATSGDRQAEPYSGR
jgi:hypothetical protein